MLAGLSSAVFRQWKHPNGTEAFNLGVELQGRHCCYSEVQTTPVSGSHSRCASQGWSQRRNHQPVTDKPDTVLIKLPLEGAGGDSQSQAQ